MKILSQIRWLVGDWHFGETRMELMCRPFRNAAHHDETLIANHNAVVQPDDVVLCVGDVTHRERPEKLELVGRLHGRKILIRGNHDVVHSDDALRAYFVDVIEDGGGLEFEIGGIPCYATHYPTQGRADRFNIVGHVHGAWRYQLNMLNVCVDNFGFYPCPTDRVPFFHKAICDGYDEDVWVAYREVNQSFRNSRGKKSRYLGDPIPS